MGIMDITIMSVHALSYGVGFLLKPMKSTSYITGLLSVLVSGLLLLIILKGGDGGSLGTNGSWYLIFSVTTVGLVPIFTMGSAFWLGRFFSTLVRWLPLTID